MANNMQGSIPRIDLTGIDPAAGPRDSRWTAVRAAVMDALLEHGSFEAVMDGLIAPELSAAVLGPGGAVESLLSLPVSAKARNIGVEENTLSRDAVRAFADLTWPDTGDISLCQSMHAYTEKAAVLEAVVRRMVLESAGATAEYIEEQAKATLFRLRLSEYAAPGTADGRVVGLPLHRDPTFLAVIMHNDIGGVEVECGRGEGGWARPALSPGSFLVFAGDMFKVLTNGRVFNPLHRVVMCGDKTRYSTILFSSPKYDVIVRPIEEAVDVEHPAVYRPFEYGDYLTFSYKPEMVQHPNKVDAFAAVRVDG